MSASANNLFVKLKLNFTVVWYIDLFVADCNIFSVFAINCYPVPDICLYAGQLEADSEIG